MIPSLISKISLKQHFKLSSPIEQKLCQATPDTPEFGLNDSTYTVRIVGIHDGDSVTIVFVFEGGLYKAKARLIGVDTPEIRTQNDHEKMLAIKARNKLANWISSDLFPLNNKFTDKEISQLLWDNSTLAIIKTAGTDKYGRQLVSLSKMGRENEKSINEILVSEGYGDSYDGGHKARTWGK